MKSKTFLLSLFVFCVLGQNCPSTDVNSISISCPELSEPYCILLNPWDDANDARFGCAECITDCDCPSGKFCSDNYVGGTLGQCISFYQEGKPCLSYSNTQMESLSISGTYKCGILMTDSSGSVRGIDRPENSGCISGVCRFCNAFDGGAATDGFKVHCSDTDGARGEPRVCMNPGIQSAFGNAFWSNAFVYNQDPVRVWLAIFFIFVVVNTFVNVALLFKSSRNGYAAV